MNSWGPFRDEDEFNLFLRGDGEALLLNELRTFFGVDFKRIEVGNTFFGRADHYFFYEDQGRLLLIESAEYLNKDHLAKDLLYLFEDITEHKIKTKVLFWILLHRPSAEIIENIHAIHNLTLIGSCRPQFHISTITNIGSSNLRINIEASFGDRTISFNGYNYLSHCTAEEIWFSKKQVGKLLGVSYSTVFNILKRWGVDSNSTRISSNDIKKLITQIEKKASLDMRLDFKDKFIPAHTRTADMLLGVELNRLLGKKGFSMREKIRPQWITLLGSSNRGYRFLYDKKDLKPRAAS